jgi:hypothetical protein
LPANISMGGTSLFGVRWAAGAGTFLPQDQGTVADGGVAGDRFVVPGSGTGELTGLRGEAASGADLGEGAAVTLDYWFE